MGLLVQNVLLLAGKDISDNDKIINTRFDILSNSCSLNKTEIMNIINSNYNIQIYKNIFYYDYLNFGLDNLFYGNSETMYKLFKYFNENLDNIIFKNKPIVNQEFFLFIENNILFSRNQFNIHKRISINLNNKTKHLINKKVGLNFIIKLNVNPNINEKARRVCYMSVCRLVCLLAHDIDLYECTGVFMCNGRFIRNSNTLASAGEA